MQAQHRGRKGLKRGLCTECQAHGNALPSLQDFHFLVKETWLSWFFPDAFTQVFLSHPASVFVFSGRFVWHRLLHRSEVEVLLCPASNWFDIRDPLKAQDEKHEIFYVIFMNVSFFCLHVFEVCSHIAKCAELKCVVPLVLTHVDSCNCVLYVFNAFSPYHLTSSTLK